MAAHVSLKATGGIVDEIKIRELLTAFYENNMSMDEVLGALKFLPYKDLEFATLDLHRGLRQGHAEVVYCEGKSAQRVGVIFAHLLEHHGRVMGTRASSEAFRAVAEVAPDAVWHAEARIISVARTTQAVPAGELLVVAAGTSDLPVAEEAAVTAEFLGNRVGRLYDVGVAGIHRLLAHVERVGAASVIIAVAGMEGALPSVVAGLASCPVVAVPTSVGYGASFGGLAALLAMLNSCASGVGVVNIDNGFGAASLASLINRR